MRTFMMAATAALTAATYSFITFGDFGTGSKLQVENAATINKHCETADACSMVLMLGDEFYNGPDTVRDKRWETELKAMYTMGSPFYAMMGNHDYAGNVNAYLNYKNDSRWHFPATNYTVVVPEADLTIVVVDSPRACPSYMSAPYGDCTEQCMLQLAAVGCTNKTDVKCWTDHVRWVNETLAAANTTWKFVAGHHPIDEENMPILAPALEAHKVQAYFSGHVHNMQHSVSTTGVNHFISGAGAFTAPAAAAEAAAGPSNLRTHKTKVHTHGDGTEYLPGDVKIGKTHRSRTLACPPGAPCGTLLSNFVADGPGFLALDIDNDAKPRTTTARFIHSNGTVIYTVKMTA